MLTVKLRILLEEVDLYKNNRKSAKFPYILIFFQGKLRILSTDEWLGLGILFVLEKEKEILSFVITWMKLGNIMLNK